MNGIILPVPASEVKYLQPKILAFDAETEVISKLREQGYNVLDGSMGTPYKIAKQNRLYPVIVNWKLPHEYKEQDIVILDFNFRYKKTVSLAYQDIPDPNTGIDRWWVDHKDGIVDPGLLNSYIIFEDIKRILDSGGVLVIFADKLNTNRFSYGKYDPYSSNFNLPEHFCSTWSILPFYNILNWLGIGFDHGSELTQSKSLNKRDPIYRLLSNHLENSNYYQTFSSTLAF